MLKNILKLNGAQELQKEEELTINGGGPLRRCCDPELYCCEPGYFINGIRCYGYSTPPACV